MAELKSLASMSLEALVKLRDDVTEILEQRAVAIEEQLSRLVAHVTHGKRDPTLKRSKSGKRSARPRRGIRKRRMATAVSRSEKTTRKAANRPAPGGKAKRDGSAKRAGVGRPAAKQIAPVEPKAVDVAAAQSGSPQSSSET